MPKHPYRVKFTDAKGTVLFGIVRSYGEEAEKAIAEGRYVVDDAVLPTAHLVQQNAVTEIPFDWSKQVRDPETWRLIEGDEYDLYVEASLAAHYEQSAANPDDRVCKGDLFTVGVADGCAYYVVVRVNKKSIRVEWRGFCPDHYVDSVLGYGGSFPRERIERLVLAHKGMQKLFQR